jgi:hypothetical protein
MDDKGRTQSSSNENSNNDVRNGEVKYGNLPQLPKMVYIPELHKSVDLKNISSPKMDVVRLDAGSFSSGQRKSISGSSLKENMSIRKVSASPDQFLSPYLSSIYLLPTPWNMSKTSLPTSIYSLLYDDVVAFALLILEIVTGRKPRNYWSYTGSDGQRFIVCIY